MSGALRPSLCTHFVILLHAPGGPCLLADIVYMYLLVGLWLSKFYISKIYEI